MRKFTTSVLLATVLLAGGLHNTASARSSDRPAVKSQRTDKQPDSTKYFWKKLQRYGN